LASLPTKLYEVVETHPGGPLIEWTGLARLIFRPVAILAEPRRGIAVVLEDRSDRRLVAGHDTAAES